MRSLLSDVRFGLRGLLSSPGPGGWSVVWLLAGLLLGVGAAHWLGEPLRPATAVSFGSGPLRVPIEAVFTAEPDAVGRLRCLARRARCPVLPPAPPPCPVPSAAPLAS